MKKYIIAIMMLLIFVLFIPSAYADTHTAASCENKTGQLDVQAAINAAEEGDTVVIPAGTCAWDTTVSVSTVNLTIDGSGATISTTAEGVYGFSVAGVKTRITNFNFVLSGGGYSILIYGEEWRIDHNTFTCTNIAYENHGIYVSTNTAGAVESKGLIDTNTFSDAKIYIAPYYANNADQAAVWFDDLNLGTDEAVYVEHNTATYTNNVSINFIDSGNGAKYVARFNTITNGYFEAHPLMTDNRRGTRKWEIYNNAMNVTAEHTAWINAYLLRAGTGVIFNNTFSGYDLNGRLADQRVVHSIGSSALKCNGSSQWDGNATITAAATAYGGGATPGTGTASANDATGVTLTTTRSGADVWTTDALIGITLKNATDGSSCIITDNDGNTVTCAALAGGSDNQWASGDTYTITNGYPCRDGIGVGKDDTLWESLFTEHLPAPAQTIIPAMIWNNKSGGSFVAVNSLYPNYAIKGRDYCENESADQPDAGDCAAFVEVYTAYTCPHPLAGTGSCDYATAGIGGYTLGSGGDTGSGHSFTGGATHSVTSGSTITWGN